MSKCANCYHDEKRHADGACNDGRFRGEGYSGKYGPGIPDRLVWWWCACTTYARRWEPGEPRYTLVEHLAYVAEVDAKIAEDSP